MRARIAIVVLAFYTVILGALAMMGAPIIAYVFYVALIAQVLIHTFWLCPKCVNMACPINPRSPDFMFGGGEGIPRPGAKPMNTTFAVSLLGITFLFGLAGVWYFSPVAWMFMFVAAVVLLYWYSKIACKSCTNKCALSGVN